MVGGFWEWAGSRVEGLERATLFFRLTLDCVLSDAIPDGVPLLILSPTIRHLASSMGSSLFDVVFVVPSVRVDTLNIMFRERCHEMNYLFYPLILEEQFRT
jgi:hypothetical protein